jgi:hypothetical protein
VEADAAGGQRAVEPFRRSSNSRAQFQLSSGKGPGWPRQGSAAGYADRGQRLDVSRKGSGLGMGSGTGTGTSRLPVARCPLPCESTATRTQAWEATLLLPQERHAVKQNRD